jgi:hypothetical protein
MGRTRTYEEAGKGNLRIIKVGGRSLVDVPHGLAWLDSLPEAKISPSRRGDSKLEAASRDELQASRSRRSVEEV